MSKTPIRVKITSTVLHYLWGAYANGWNGAVAAAYAFIGQAVGDNFIPSKIPPATWQTFVFVFAVHFGINILTYFKAHPLPENFPDLGDDPAPVPPVPPVASSPALAMDPDKPFAKAEAAKQS